MYSDNTISWLLDRERIAKKMHAPIRKNSCDTDTVVIKYNVQRLSVLST